MVDTRVVRESSRTEGFPLSFRMVSRCFGCDRAESGVSVWPHGADVRFVKWRHEPVDDSG